MEGKITSFDNKIGQGYIIGENNLMYSFNKENILDKKATLKTGSFISFKPKVLSNTKIAESISIAETFTKRLISEKLHFKNIKPIGKIEKSFELLTIFYATKDEAKKTLSDLAHKMGCNAIYKIELKEAVGVISGVRKPIFQIKATAAIVTKRKPCITRKEEEDSKKEIQIRIKAAESVYVQLQTKEKNKKTEIKKKSNIGLYALSALVALVVLSSLIYYVMK